MRISMKVAPGVRVSGRLGGHHHHHHHGGGATFATGNKGPWLRSVPPWRLRSVSGLTGVLLAAFYLGVWALEIELWLVVWCYYVMFLGARQLTRWIWRRNPIGQTIDSHAARHGRRQRPPYDPHGAPPAPVDLGALSARTRSYDRD